MTHNKIFILSTLLLLLCICFASAQKTSIKTLQQRIKNPSINTDSIISIYRKLTHLYVKDKMLIDALMMAQKESELHLNNQRNQNNKYIHLLELGEVYFNIASLHRSMSDYTNALIFAKKSLKIYKSELGKLHPETLSVYRFLAGTYYLSKEYKSSLEYINIALEAYSKLEKRQPEGEIDLKILLGCIYIQIANFDKAQQVLTNTQELYHQFEGKVDKDLLNRIYVNLASLKLKKQATIEALAYFLKIASNRRKRYHENHLILRTTYTDIGFCYYKLGDYDKALVYHRKSLAILYNTYGEVHDLIAFTHNHIGGTYKMLEEKDSAKYHFFKSVKIYKILFGKDDYNIIGPLWQLAKLHFKQKAYVKAEAALEKCIIIQHKYFGNKHPDLAKMYLDMSFLLEAKFKYNKAYHLIQKAYSANCRKQKIIDNYLMLSIIGTQIRMSMHLPYAEKQKSFLLLHQIDSIIDLCHQELSFLTDKKNLIQDLRHICNKGIELCYFLYQLKKEDKYLVKIFELIERNKAVLFDIRIKQQYLTSNHTKTKEEELYSKIQVLEREWKKAEYYNDSLQIENLQQQLFECHKLYESDYTHLEKRHTSQKPIKLKVLQSHLSNNQAILNYFYGTEHLYILNIRQRSIQINQIPLNFDKEMMQFSTYLFNLEQSKNSLKESCQKYDQHANNLYKKLLPQANCNQLVIIPDGKLNYIPFEALTSQINKVAKGFHQLNYALNKYTISYANSASSYYYQQFKHTNKKDGKILGFAPEYNLDPQLASLRSNRLEVKFLESHFAGSYYYNKNADKDKFREQCTDFSILHLALHGYADHNELNQPKLFFASKNKDSLSSTLYPYEITQLSLQSDFVVLSACQTGIGYWQKGEGVMSLARDFMYTGVPSVLTTLWQINDKSSNLIVQEFYSQLKNSPKDLSLQKSKQHYLNKASAFYAHPIFWSGYILLGNTNRLYIDTIPSKKIWYLGNFIFTFIIIILIYRTFRL
ncbi:CHAT domain-containing protein [Aureispira]|nr:CHAT domain-containing protein [Aureispira sp.]